MVQQHKGFSLLEVLVVLAMMGIVFVMMVPVSENFIVSNKMTSRVHELRAILQFARQQAASLEKPLTLVSEEENWSSDILLFLDNNGNHLYDEGEVVLHHWQWNVKDIMVHWKGFYSNDYLVFSPSYANSALSGSFEICPAKSSYVSGQTIVINRLGRMRLEALDC